MIEFLLASMLSCQESQNLLNRVNEYSSEAALCPQSTFKKSLKLSKKTTRSVNLNERSEHN